MAKLDLGKQIGPLPLGAWLAVVGVGLIIAYYSSRGDGGSFVGTDEDELAGDETFVEDISADPGVGEGGFTYTPPPIVTGGEGDPSDAIDNDEWLRRAIAKMIQDGYDPGWVNAALNKALSGTGGLSIREWSIWRETLRKYGPPPYPVGVRPPKSTPDPVKPKDPPRRQGSPIQDRWYRVKAAPLPGSTLRGISKMAYGDPAKWRIIFDANRKGRELPRYRGRRREGKLTNPSVLRPGTLLYIPRAGGGGGRGHRGDMPRNRDTRDPWRDRKRRRDRDRRRRKDGNRR